MARWPPSKLQAFTPLAKSVRLLAYWKVLFEAGAVKGAACTMPGAARGGASRRAVSDALDCQRPLLQCRASSCTRLFYAAALPAI